MLIFLKNIAALTTNYTVQIKDALHYFSISPYYRISLYYRWFDEQVAAGEPAGV